MNAWSWGLVTYVDANSPNPVHPYTSWGTAARDIKSAVDVTFATNVLVGNGTYYPTQMIEVYYQHVQSVNGPEFTIVDGSQLDMNRPTIFFLNGQYTNTPSIIEGFTITGASQNGVDIRGPGTVRNCIVQSNVMRKGFVSAAGIEATGNAHGLARIHDTIVRHNTSTSGTAGMAVGGNTVVSNCVIEANVTTAMNNWPGGIYISEGGHVMDSLIVSNRANQPPFEMSGEGGGVTVRQHGTLERCTMAHNFAGGVGGGIIASWGTNPFDVLIKDCVISNNLSNAYGGAAYISNGGLFQDCAFTDNHANSHGGGAFCRVGSGIARYNLFEQCLFADNTASNGAGIYAPEGIGTQVRSSILTGNQARNKGGGVYAANGAVFQHCTVAYNHADDSAGGMWADGLTVENAIVYDNTAPTNANWHRVAPGVWNHGCVWPAVGVNPVTNPPVFVSAAAGDFRLAAGSPCIDAGLVIPAVTHDYARVPLPLDGNADGTAEHDIGAHEYAGAGDTDQDGLTDHDEVYIHASHPRMADTDGDGQSDGDEVIADTCPTNAHSVLLLRGLRITPGGVRVEWQGGVQARQILKRTDNLTQPAAWQGVYTNEPPTDTEEEFLDTLPETAPRFYRITVERP